METPSSARLAARSLNAIPKAAKPVGQQDDDSCSDKGHRAALVDITNDSPIVGLAAGSAILKTPGSSAVKAHPRRRVPLRTPGSGEALLRCQVKALLQKVEEETEPQLIAKALSPDAACDLGGNAEAQLFKILLGHLRSPSGLLAPTPANTPVILGLPAGDDKALALSLLEQQGYLANIQKSTDGSSGSSMGNGTQKEESIAVVEECQINRALLFDSPGKSDTVSSPANSSSCGSAVTFLGSADSTNEDSSTSAWSIQARAGSLDEEEDNEGEVALEAQADAVYEENEEEGGSEAAGDVLLDGLCQNLSKLTVIVEGEESRGGNGLPEFAGKHVRFVYDSDDDEMEGVVVEESDDDGPSTSHSCCVARSPSVLGLKGLPTPKGKHLRFQEEED